MMLTCNSRAVMAMLFTAIAGLQWASTARASSCLSMFDTHVLDNDTAFVGGNLGYLLKTEDKGRSWSLLDTGIESLITEVFFMPGGQVGFTAGIDGELIRTGDGGRSWHVVDRKLKTMIADISFPSRNTDDSTGYASGDHGTILKTEDGGMTWHPLKSGTRKRILSIVFIDNLNGFAGGEDGLLQRTNNGGETWEDISLSEDGAVVNLFMNPETKQGLAVISSGSIYYSHDIGATWHKAETLPNIYLSSAVLLSDGKTGFASGMEGVLLKTADGGVSWVVQEFSFGRDVYSIGFSPDGRLGYAAGTDGLLAVYQADKGWTESDLSELDGLDCGNEDLFSPAGKPSPEQVQASVNPSCNPQSNAYKNKRPLQGPKGIVLLEDVGDTAESAIVICFAPDNAVGVETEYMYLGFLLGRNNYLYSQSLKTTSSGGIFDHFEFEMPDGTTRNIYFDISDFFGKY